MLSAPTCPVCNASEWQTLGTRTWKKSDLPQLDPVLQRRLRVLYEVWCPGADEFTATSELCQECGMVIYSPRPSAEDIDAKYRFLTDLGPDTAVESIESEYSRIRERALFDCLAPRLPLATGNRLLDFGGGDGRLMRHFIDRGDVGFVIDYVRETVPGVTRLGDTLEQLGAGEKFTGIISSHVLEHVAEPLQILKQLVSHLAPDGRLFIELPMEIWKTPPLHPEPVTHVNFFTAESLRYMMMKAGLEVEVCRTEGITLPGRADTVIRGVGHLAKTALPLPQGGAAAVRELLAPGVLTKLWWLSLNPRFLAMAVKSRLRKLWPGSGK